MSRKITVHDQLDEIGGIATAPAPTIIAIPTSDDLRRFAHRISRITFGVPPRPTTGRRTARCRICGRFKPRPSTRCDWCGDEPVTHNGDPYEYDRAHGWEW